MFDTKQTSHDKCIIFLIIYKPWNNRNTVLESHDIFDYFLFHLFLVCHVRFLPQLLGVKSQIDRLSIGRGLLSLVKDSVVSPLDRLGKKLNIDRSFLLRSAMTTCQQYCASDHVLSIHETGMLIGSPHPISRHDIIGSCYPEHSAGASINTQCSIKTNKDVVCQTPAELAIFRLGFFFFITIFCATMAQELIFSALKYEKRQWRSLA